jgi:hypothetical protein
MLEAPLGRLLKEFGPPRESVYPAMRNKVEHERPGTRKLSAVSIINECASWLD